MNLFALRLISIFLFISLFESNTVFARKAADTVNKNICGWLDNSTPGNATLIDKDGEWLLAQQGIYEAKGNWTPDLKGNEVYTNGMHGYGCVCMKVNADEANKKIIRISSVKVNKLSICRKDTKIKKKEPAMRER